MIREDLILKRVRSKKVLDIGSVGQSGEYCLFDLIRKECASIVGVDLPEAGEVAKTGFSVDDKGLSHTQDSRIVYGNMETLQLGEQFDVIIAGDVIEHVFNPGLFLKNIHQHLVPNGELIITTPNAKWPTVFLRPNPTHVLWHDVHTLKYLVEQNNFSVKEFRYYCGNKPYYNWLKRVLAWQQSIYMVAHKV